ncbi:MAG: hypothetical protein ACLFTR_04845 [Candidatus Woesearchaeota archaeon]
MDTGPLYVALSDQAHIDFKERSKEYPLETLYSIGEDAIEHNDLLAGIIAYNSIFEKEGKLGVGILAADLLYAELRLESGDLGFAKKASDISYVSMVNSRMLHMHSLIGDDKLSLVERLVDRVAGDIRAMEYEEKEKHDSEYLRFKEYSIENLL